MIHSAWVPQALYVAAHLELPDLLAEGPRASRSLAQAVGAHEPSLHRLLRALVTLEIVSEREDGRFELAPLGELLRRDHAGSMRAWALLVGRYQWPLWGQLLESVRTGESARKRLAGTEGFEHLERDPDAAAIFNRAMTETTRLIGPRVAAVADLSRAKTVVDVGGGYGELLAAVLLAHPALRGVLYDLPHASEHGRRHIEEAGLAARCEVVAGDFFERVPEGADAYLLKSILHDWDDERSGLLLRNIRKAMPAAARLLIVERVVPERLGTSEADRALVRVDLNMLISHAAKERTEREFRGLLEAAGLRLDRLVDVGRGYGMIDARPQ